MYPKKLMAVLFPNPNEGKFKVKLTGLPSKKIELTVCDISGKTIKRQTIHNFNGDHTELIQLELISGVYTLLINSSNETLSRQFIIN
jgi:Fe2+ transport system protein B